MYSFIIDVYSLHKYIIKNNLVSFIKIMFDDDLFKNKNNLLPSP